MKPLKIAGAAIAAIIVVAGLVLVIGIPSSFLTSAIQARVERETGYRLMIAGSTKIGVWPSLNVTLNDVTLQDPKDRDSSDRLTVGSIEANIKLASLWSGAPEVTELVVDHPVLTVPLLRERTVPRNSPPRGVVTATEAEANDKTVSIGRVTVTDGAIVFSNLRDRVTNRVDGINAKATIGDDRNIRATGTRDTLVVETIGFNDKAALDLIGHPHSESLRVVERYFGRNVAQKTAFWMEYQGEGWMNPGSNSVYAQVRSTDEHPLCPICTMEVDPKIAPKSVFAGKTYYFCSKSCCKKFEKDPAKYISQK